MIKLLLKIFLENLVHFSCLELSGNEAMISTISLLNFGGKATKLHTSFNNLRVSGHSLILPLINWMIVTGAKQSQKHTASQCLSQNRRSTGLFDNRNVQNNCTSEDDDLQKLIAYLVWKQFLQLYDFYSSLCSTQLDMYAVLSCTRTLLLYKNLLLPNMNFIANININK